MSSQGTQWINGKVWCSIQICDSQSRSATIPHCPPEKCISIEEVRLKKRLYCSCKKWCETAWYVRLPQTQKVDKRWMKKALCRPFDNYRIPLPHFYKWGLWRPEEFNDLLGMEGFHQKMGERGQKIQTGQNLTKLFHVSVSPPIRFPESISLPIYLGDAAQMSAPLQNLPSFSRPELTVSILNGPEFEQTLTESEGQESLML